VALQRFVCDNATLNIIIYNNNNNTAVCGKTACQHWPIWCPCYRCQCTGWSLWAYPL